MSLDPVLCRTNCGVPIIFAVQLHADGTTGNVVSPIEALPSRDPGRPGNIELVRDHGGRLVGATYTDWRGVEREAAVYRITSLDERRPGELHRNHFADCPNRDSVRRRASAGARR